MFVLKHLFLCIGEQYRPKKIPRGLWRPQPKKNLQKQRTPPQVEFLLDRFELHLDQFDIHIWAKIVLIKFRALLWNVIAHIKRRYLLHGDGCISSFWELGSLIHYSEKVIMKGYTRSSEELCIRIICTPFISASDLQASSCELATSGGVFRKAVEVSCWAISPPSASPTHSLPGFPSFRQKWYLNMWFLASILVFLRAFYP